MSELQEAISKEKLIAKAFTITEEFVEYYLISFMKKIKKYDECKLDMFETFIRRIIVFDDHIEIQYNYNKDIPILDNHAVLPCSSMHNLVVRNVINSKPIYFTDDYFYILCSA